MDTARDFELILLNGTLMPEKLSVSNATVIAHAEGITDVMPVAVFWFSSQ